MKRLLILGIFSSAVFAGSQVKSWHSNGVEVWFVADDSVPMLDLTLVFDAGSIREAQQKGLAKITNSSLFTGCGSWSEAKVAAGFEAIGAQYSAAVSDDYAEVGLRLLSDKKYLMPAISNLARCLRQPAFNVQAVNKVRAVLASDWHASQKKSTIVALSYLKKHFYPNHPYGRYPNVAPEDMKKNTVADISRFYRTHYNKQNARLVMVGDLSIKDAKQVAGMVTKSLLNGVVLPKLSVPKINRVSDAELHLPNQSQDTTVIAFTGVSARNKLAPALDLANFPLSSAGLTSRLMHELRDKNGYTYAVQGLMKKRSLGGEYYLIFKSRPKVSKLAANLARDTVSSYSRTGAKESEFAISQKTILQNLIEARSSISGKAYTLVEIAGLGLGLDYYDGYYKLIEHATLLEVNQSFKGLFAKQVPATVVVSNGK